MTDGVARQPVPGFPTAGSGPSHSTPDPVFVLCAGRSGSTLLRFLLDAHPDLACPPETNVPALCGQLATVWSLIEGAPLSANRGDEPPEIPDAAIAGVRETMDRMVGSYLARRGKKRYCDKSLGTARFAYLLTRIWPQSRFLCLYRHPMDVIASGIEACPWGLNGYGFDPYIAETPGNAVWALARFWADNMTVIRAAEQQYPERCHRVRYEDLVADPQGTADAAFRFLGVDPVPGIAEACFAPERERFGPADYKIWHTSRITSDSVGRGWTIPVGLAAPALQRLNDLCDQLGYLPVDESWGTAERPADLRVTMPGTEFAGASPTEPVPARPLVAVAGGPAEGGPEEGGPAAGGSTANGSTAGGSPAAGGSTVGDPGVAERLAAGLARLGEDFAKRWEPCSADTFMLVATPATGSGPAARWRVSLPTASVTTVIDRPADADTARDGAARDGTGRDSAGRDSAARDDAGEEPESAWDVIGSADTWEQILGGRANLSVALRHNQLRYCDTGDAGPVAAEARIGMLSELLGLTSWRHARRHAEPAPAPVG
jgi:hypothetical protein